jgi:hypothetical protein
MAMSTYKTQQQILGPPFVLQDNKYAVTSSASSAAHSALLFFVTTF